MERTNSARLFKGQRKTLLLAVSAFSIGFNPIASAQPSAPSDGVSRQLEEVLVQARKREESLQDVPVTVQAFDATTLEAFATTRFQDIADLTSGLSIYTDSTTNPSVNLRGIQGNAINARQDEPVSVNLDGIPHSSSNILRLNLFDLQAVEVLKGPQALYFGKNSPGGIISMRTANPTDEFYTEFQLSHEFNGENTHGYGIVSGPLNDNWGARVAFRAATQEGYFQNIWGDGDPTATQPLEEYGPNFEEMSFIGTLRGEFDRGDVTLKVLYGDRDSSGEFSMAQNIVCNSNQDLNPFTDCTLDERFATESWPQGIDGLGLNGTTFGPAQSTLAQSGPGSEFDATQVSLDWSYELNDNWQINSITGYVDMMQSYIGSIGARPATGPSSLNGGQDLFFEIFTQELRFTGTFDRLNVMFGGFMDDRTTDGVGAVFVSGFKFTPDVYIDVSAESYSLFAQAEYELTDTMTLSVGGRYTEEDLEQSSFNLPEPFSPSGFGGLFGVPGLFGIPGENFISPDELSYDNFSPEVTLSFAPASDSDLNFFVSYREGFKSGGFNASLSDIAPTSFTGVPINDSFNEELVSGFEAGAKMMLLDNSLRLNLAVFSYEYDDLQQPAVQVNEQGAVITGTLNAAEATVRGIEADFYWATPVEGLDMTGNIAFNDNEFGAFTRECNDFQITVDPSGCDIDIDDDPTTDAGGLLTGTGFDAQSLEGQALRRAPEWSGSVGFVYERPIFNDLLFTATGTLIYSDEYRASGDGDPRGLQDDFWLVNGSVGVGSANGGWEVRLIGRNLTDEIALASTFANDPGAPPPGEAPNYGGIPTTPWQAFLQLTLRPTLLGQ